MYLNDNRGKRLILFTLPSFSNLLTGVQYVGPGVYVFTTN